METAESNLKAAEAKAAALATAAAAARAEAAAAVSGSESTASTVEQVTKELNDMKAVMAGECVCGIKVLLLHQQVQRGCMDCGC